MKDPALLDHSDDQILAAFAALMLGSSPLEPSASAFEIAAMASRLAEPRPSRPGDVEATRALRSVYMLARDHAAEGTPPSGRNPVLRWAVLDEVLRLRHRQRAALTLRFVLGLSPAAVARVLGVSKPRAREIAEAGAVRVNRSFGRRVDIGRHLRSVAGMLGPAPEPAPAARPAEARPVFRLLLSKVAEVPATRSPAPVASLRPRPIYNVPLPAPAAPAPVVPRVESAPAKPRRVALAVAACIAALTFLGAFVPAAIVTTSRARLPVAAVPIAPVVQEVRDVVAAPSASFAVVVRPGDTLWSIAGRVLGSEARWGELWRANAGRLMADGLRFLDPDLIQPGWKLRLPAR